MNLPFNIDSFNLSSLDQSLWIFFKIPVLLGFLLYMVFALVVIKQVNKMTETLAVGMETVLNTIAIIHFLLAFATFAVAFFIL